MQPHLNFVHFSILKKQQAAQYNEREASLETLCITGADKGIDSSFLHDNVRGVPSGVNLG